MAEEAVVPQNEEDNKVYLSDEGAETLVFLLASQLDQEDRGKVLVENNQTKHFALQEIISALQAKQGETMSALFEKDDARQEALAKALQFSRSEKFLMDGNEVNKNTFGFGEILEEDQARLVMKWMGWKPYDYKNLDEYKKGILDKEIKKVKKRYEIKPPEEVYIVSSFEDQVVSAKPNIFQRVLRIDPNKTANTQGLSDKPVAESAPAAPQPQPTSVAASLSNTWDVADVVNVSEAMSRIKKTYGRPISDRIDRNSSRIFGIAGFTTLAAVGLAIATPVVGAIGLGAFAWGAAALAAKATVGLIGFGAAGKLLRSSLRVFEGEKATTQRQQADAYDAQCQQISLELIQSNADKYGNELRAQLRLPSRLPAPENVATAAPAPAVATAQTAPVAAAPARDPVAVEQTAPVTTVTPEPVAVVEPPAPEPAPEPVVEQTVVEQSAPEPAPAPVAAAQPAREPAAEQSAPAVVAAPAREPAPEPAPAPVAVSPRWGDSAPYELYRIDTANDVSFAGSLSINTQFSGATFVADVALGSNYKSSFTDADLVRLGLSQQRTN
jgi:hypothetical protein